MLKLSIGFGKFWESRAETVGSGKEKLEVDDSAKDLFYLSKQQKSSEG